MPEESSDFADASKKYWDRHKAIEQKWHALWEGRKDYEPGPASAIPPQPEHPDGEGADSFGYKSGWLAIRSDSPEKVALALGIREPEWHSWTDGIIYSGLDIGYKLDSVPCLIAITPPLS